MARRAVSSGARRQLTDRLWRLDNLYEIRGATGQVVPFRLNAVQRHLFDALHPMNVVLKARQLGITSFVQLFMLDACLFNSNVAAATVAHTLADAEAIFREKIRLPYERLPDDLKELVPIVSDSARVLSFANGSSLRVGTSLRSGTYQYLHISEHGKISAKFPDKALEIRTGALNTVHAGQTIFIESTAEGQGGDFYELCQQARRRANSGEQESPLDFRFHFFPWWQEPAYALDPAGVTISSELDAYFDRLQGAGGVSLNDGQRAWYARKAELQGAEMAREFPSTPDEAFAAAVEGAYYAAELARAERDGRICAVPWEPAVPVNTFWDLGRNDDTVIWFHQRVGREHRFIDHYRNSGEGLGHYAQLLRERGYSYGTHYLPHDVELRELSTNRSRRDFLEGLGVRPIRTVPLTRDLRGGIQSVRAVLPACWFDAVKCAAGIADLRQYRRAWDDKRAVWQDLPQHDAASHAADAFRTFAEGWYEAPDASWPAQVGLDYDPFNPETAAPGAPRDAFS
jgi:hypothetical protein